ncbi:MAG: aminoglycoside phosphotransferase family protein [Chloroflexi bacterium]|nr:aminoglycoside phosphotransferase family protein [Chloroflexota bacterium]MCC6892299.1 aminoglycoside phosphotransferase family protein [Anaerolineae bacterium]
MIDFSALANHQDMLSPGSPEVAQLRADAVMLLTEIDARENLQTQKVIPLPAGMWNALYRLEPSGLVVKLSANDNDFEVNFLRQAAALGVPAPQVLGAGRVQHPTLAEATYFLMTYIPNSINAWPLVHGQKAMQPDNVEQLGADLGRVLARLHSVPLGYITRFGTRVESWQETLTDGFSPNWDDPQPNALFDDKLLPIFKRILAQTDYFGFKEGALIHGDLNLSNVLVDAQTHQLSAILDPGGYAGMPMFDLAYAAMPWDYGWAFHQAMLASYREQADDFDAALFYASTLVVAYRHNRFHMQDVKASIFADILPHLG